MDTRQAGDKIQVNPLELGLNKLNISNVLDNLITLLEIQLIAIFFY